MKMVWDNFKERKREKIERTCEWRWGI